MQPQSGSARISFDDGSGSGSDDELLPSLSDASESRSRSESYSAISASFSESLRQTISVTLTFHDITVMARPVKRYAFGFGSTDTGSNDRVTLLDHVSGYAKPGEVLAIMGASGSGKSTLLNVIMHHSLAKNLDVSGSVRVNGREIGHKISRISGYLQQDDLLFPTLTVKEYMRFQVALSLGDVLDQAAQEDKTLDMLTTMGLVSCQHNQIGTPGLDQSISGGEMKRLAFAAELLTDPAVMFCDEPTTGLDSFRAEQVVAILRQLARLGKTIICVIHQPSSTVFEMFNRVVFLANGKVAYQGQTSSATEFFHSTGHICPDFFSLPDYAVSVLAMTGPNLQEAEERIDEICGSYSSSPLQAHVYEEIASVVPSEKDTRLTKKTEKLPGYRVPIFSQLYWLLWRALLDLIRDPRVLRTRISQKIILGVVYGLTFHGTVQLTQAGIQNANGAMMSLVIESSFRILLNIVQMYNAQLPVFHRESSSYMYRPIAYYIALLISWFPVFLIDTTIFVSIGYFLMGLSFDSYKFGMTLLASLAIANVSAAVGSFIAYMAPSVGLAINFAQQTQYLMMIFSGALYITLNSFPKYLGWLQYFSWMRYGFEAMAIVHWSDIVNITCTDNGTETCLRDGQSVLAAQDYDTSRLDFDFYMLGVLFFGFHLAAFICLLIRIRMKY